MASRGVNKVILVGNVGQDPDIKTFDDGNSIANLTLATSESWKDRNTGEQQERTEWHRIAFRGAITQVVQNYVKKGSKLYVEGKLQTRKWQDQNGADRYTTEIVVDMNGSMQMLDSNGGGGNASAGASAGASTGASQAQGGQSSGQGGGKVQQARDAQQSNNNGAEDDQGGGYAPDNPTAPEPVDDFDDDIPF